ncbi:MAG: branched-chain amino acid ABC transporter permease [Atopobium sp.]|jgi:inner-membrane translocator|uniref:Branched-chain amino acid ABC transporter permease n=1 Tax=Lancefieldella parvula TaxID=1382 RepID=A0A930VYZ5_9ACTN|nr:branched-chain amino acid ABC transporter permease [Lancefieldella parvula]MBF0894995.1 branched-chain amino acid ABC transporter permease [Atopobium sp.]MBF0895665.1 branched-chain amino acid ABC transporter permease [Atopobium sp.]MBF0905036.1 branched-chain amino acid ABC transporter permease [Atopobium sp.]MBF0912560.1 branched-chain amino acid ABC transporter permease [Atopobium sp.]MBF0916284.1 branched-chain amino acid ABC transporter permease [Atopobium sp.]
MFLTQVLNGLQLGSIYALVALGYTMVYGIILLLNFAHGDIIMFGSYVAWIALVQLGLNPAIAVLLAIFGCVLLGVLIDKVAYAPLREAPRLSILITAIGVSYLLENGVQLLLGADAKVVPSIIDLGTVQVFGSTLSGTALLTVAVTIVATVVLTLLVQKTRLGKAMRAVSEDMGAARLMGVNVNSTISFTFAVGSALAGIAAILYSMAYQQVSPTMGVMLGTKAFVAAVLGGIGSIPGAVIGGLIVGFSEVFVAAFGLSVWQDAVVFLLLILVLVVKPTGLLGRPVTEKV